VRARATARRATGSYRVAPRSARDRGSAVAPDPRRPAPWLSPLAQTWEQLECALRDPRKHRRGRFAGSAARSRLSSTVRFAKMPPARARERAPAARSDARRIRQRSCGREDRATRTVQHPRRWRAAWSSRPRRSRRLNVTICPLRGERTRFEPCGCRRSGHERLTRSSAGTTAASYGTPRYVSINRGFVGISSALPAAIVTPVDRAPVMCSQSPSRDPWSGSIRRIAHAEMLAQILDQSAHLSLSTAFQSPDTARRGAARSLGGRARRVSRRRRSPSAGSSLARARGAEMTSMSRSRERAPR